MYLMIICLGSMLPSTSSDLPDSRSGRSMAVHLSEFGLASDGVCRARHVTMPAVVSYTAFPPLPGRYDRPGCLFLLHFPWSHLHRTLSGILPCEARTFLTCISAAAIICPTDIDLKSYLIQGRRNLL